MLFRAAPLEHRSAAVFIGSELESDGGVEIRTIFIALYSSMASKTCAKSGLAAE